MDTYRPKYYIVDWVVKAVYHIVHLAQQFLSSVAARNGLAGLEPTSWTELLQLMPSSYLRLVITLEMSIGQGKLPEESDFPPTLRGSAQISLSMPGVGKFLPCSPAGQREREQEREEEQGRVTEVTEQEQEQGQGPNLTYDFDIAAAMDFMGDDMSFETPQPGQGGGPFETQQAGQAAMSFDRPQGQSEGISQPGDPSLFRSVENNPPDLDAMLGNEFQNDEFDKWANRVLGIDAIPF